MKSFQYNLLSLSVAFTVTTFSAFGNSQIETRTVLNSENAPITTTKSVSLDQHNLSGNDEWIVVLKQKPLLLEESFKELQKLTNTTDLRSLETQRKIKRKVRLNEEAIHASQNEVLKSVFAAEFDVNVKRRFSRTINAVTIRASENEVKAFKSHTNVLGVYKNIRVRKLLNESVGLIGAPAAWEKLDASGQTLTGKGITVAVIDSGVDYTHPDLGGCIGEGCKVLGGYDFVEKDSDPMDVDGHGTHVAGIVAANGTLRGVAPDANILAVRVLGDDGYGDNSDIIAGIEYAVDPDGDPTTDDGANVINMSLGGMGDHGSPGSLAADAAVKAGVVVVVAAGNEGNYKDIANHSPASSKLSITVGSTEKSGELSSFSSKGPLGINNHIKPEVVAPGGEINSLTFGSDYTVLSGTSMASPHVAGAAALLLQNNGELQPADVKSLLMSSSNSIGLDPYAQGYGLINVNNALDYRVVSNTPPVDFGNLTAEQEGNQLSATIELINLHSTSDIVNLAVSTDWPEGVELGLESSEIVIGAMDNKSITVYLNVNDLSSIPFKESAPGAYFGNIRITPESSPAFDIPISFKRNHTLTITHDSPNGIDVSVDSDNGTSLYWGPIGPSETREIELAPGKLYFTVDYLQLSAFDLPHIDGFADDVTSKATINGFTTREVDVTQSVSVNFSTTELTTPIGVDGTTYSHTVNLFTAFSNLQQNFTTDSGVEISYGATSTSNTNIREGQKNKYLVVGNVSPSFDVNYEIVERLDNVAGADTLLHFHKKIDSTISPTIYSTFDVENEVLLQHDLDAEETDYDFVVSSLNSTWDSDLPVTGTSAKQVQYGRVPNSDNNPVQFTLLATTAGSLSGERLISSPPVSFHSQDFTADGDALSAYNFVPYNAVFAGSVEISGGNAYLMGEYPSLMSVNETQTQSVSEAFTVYCNGEFVQEGNLKEESLEQALSGCQQNILFELIVNNGTDGKTKQTRVEHSVEGDYSIINGVNIMVVDANNTVIPDLSISTKKVYLSFSSSNNERVVSEVQWKLNNQEEWHSVEIENTDEGRFTQRAALPQFLTELNTIDVRVVHFGVGSKSTHTFVDMLTVGVDLTSTEDDIDNDGIVNAVDRDNDNDGIPDDWERQYGFNPLNSSDAILDGDGDGISNYQEYYQGLNPTSNDTDNDGVLDGVDGSPRGNQPIVAGKLIELSDLNGDGNNEFANVVLDNGIVFTHILDGTRQIITTQYTHILDSEQEAFTAVLSHYGSDTALIFFGVRTDELGLKRSRALSINVATGSVNAIYNWPAIFDEPTLVQLDDINNDGTPELGLSGIHNELSRPQMIVRDGVDGTAFTKYSFPSIFHSTQYKRFSDVNSDSVDDIAMMGRLLRNEKVQIKVTDAVSGELIHAYTFPNNWDDVSFHKLSDINYDGANDWGLLGKNKVDGRWQLIQKDGSDPRGVLQIHAWPGDFVDPRFVVLPDMSGDGIEEVAMFGVRGSVGRVQMIIKDGVDRNSVIGTYGWADVFVDTRFNVTNDLTGDGVPDIVFSGKLENERWQTFIINAATNERIFRQVSKASITNDIEIRTSHDINFDGRMDLLIFGRDNTGVLQSEVFLLP